MINEVIVTLYEGHYHYGVAALINSLVHQHFKGLMLIGYRGELPFWCNQLQQDKQSHNTFLCSLDFKVEFRNIDIEMHFGYYKPYFINQAFEYADTVEAVYYFDPDIIVVTEWGFFQNWIKNGVPLCIDVSFPFVHYNHPWRQSWRKLWSDENEEISSLNIYVNSGFVGFNRTQIPLLEAWIRITDKYIQFGHNTVSFDQAVHHSPYKGDQDLLNAALTVKPNIPLSILGMEGMGFREPAFPMYHALGDKIKPWKKQYLKTLLRKGSKPSMAETVFFSFIKYPISLFSKREEHIKRLDLKFAKILGRIIG